MSNTSSGSSKAPLQVILDVEPGVGAKIKDVNGFIRNAGKGSLIYSGEQLILSVAVPSVQRIAAHLLHPTTRVQERVLYIGSSGRPSTSRTDLIKVILDKADSNGFRVNADLIAGN